MKKIFIASTLFLGLTTSLLAIDLAGCKGCHGQNYEKVALGKSKVVKDMTKEELMTSLKGYQDGTYGGPLKGLMKGQLTKYSPEEINEIVEIIYLQANGEK